MCTVPVVFPLFCHTPVCYKVIRPSGWLLPLHCMFTPIHDSTFQFLRYQVEIPALHDFTLCIWVKSSNFSNPHPLFSYSSKCVTSLGCFLFLWAWWSLQLWRDVLLQYTWDAQDTYLRVDTDTYKNIYASLVEVLQSLIYVIINCRSGAIPFRKFIASTSSY
jgi:hypothetical protein